MPTVQFRDRPGLIDLGWGHPHPEALPVEEWALAYARAVRAGGADALTYGAPAGPAALVDWLCEHLGAVDGPVRPEEVFIAAGASHALELLCALLVRPGDTVLADAPTYHLALRILGDHAARVRPVPTDGDGIDPPATRRLLDRLVDDGHRVPLLYLVPTFNNPSGQSLPPSRRTALLSALRGTGVLLVEDDTYRELSYDGDPPKSLYAQGGGTGVARIGSFAKTVAPGIRLGFLSAPPDLVSALVRRGYVDSGGGVNHTTALAMASFGRSGYREHLRRIRERYRSQRDALLSAVDRELPGVTFTRPAGGWFLWLRLPSGVDSAALLPAAERVGVSYLPGRTFFLDGRGGEFVRLSFSMLGADRLRAGIERLAAVLPA